MSEMWLKSFHEVINECRKKILVYKDYKFIKFIDCDSILTQIDTNIMKMGLNRDKRYRREHCLEPEKIKSVWDIVEMFEQNGVEIISAKKFHRPWTTDDTASYQDST